MNRLANVLLCASDPELLDTLVNVLADNNYTALAYEAPAEALAEARASCPDLVVVEVDGPGFDGWRLLADLAADPETRTVPRVALGRGGGDLLESALAARLDDAFALPLDAAEFLYRLRPLLRLSTMRAELHRRARLAPEFGVNADIEGMLEAPDDDEPVRILAVGSAEAADALPGILGVPSEVEWCDDYYQAEDRLTDSFFDAAVVEAGQDGEAALHLCSRVRHNPRLFNLPMVVLTPDGVVEDRADAYRRGATRVLSAPPSPAELRHAVLTLVGRQRLRWRIREAIDSTRMPALCDPLTGLYSFDFLSRHLESLVDAARTWKKHLTVVFFSVPSVAGVEEQFGEEAADNLVWQLGKWIEGLVRVEDMAARYEGSDFAVALPDTPIAEARTVMHRIAGILSYTDFAVQEVYQPITVWVEVGMAELAPGDTAESLVARAHRDLE